MVDCTGLDLTKGSTEQTINGLYARVKDAMAMNKEIIAYNCNWGGLPVTPIGCMAIQVLSNTIVATASTLQIWITSADKVTIVNLAPTE